MTRSTFKVWFWLHKWSSIVCTAFLLMLCITGLPLIFHEEIDHLVEPAPAYGMPGIASHEDAPDLLPFDRMMELALDEMPGEVPVFMAFDNDDPLMTITTAPAPDARVQDMTTLSMDRSTGAIIGAETDAGVMNFILRLHADMFLGLPGMLFLGFMGLLFVVALITGVVLYAPFMRKLDFGTLRVSRGRRLKWLDYHNFLGVVALVWALVVGLTGVINTLATPIIQAWQASELAEMTSAYEGQPPLLPSEYGSIDRTMAQARAAMPGNQPQFIAFPGGMYSSGHHYTVFFQGDTALTERLLTPALIDASTGELTDVRPLPWYVQALLVSQPLHFGDYGGLPMKILWAILTIFTIVVLGSGLYLWLARPAGRHVARERSALCPDTAAAVGGGA